MVKFSPFFMDSITLLWCQDFSGWADLRIILPIWVQYPYKKCNFESQKTCFSEQWFSHFCTCCRRLGFSRSKNLLSELHDRIYGSDKCLKQCLYSSEMGLVQFEPWFSLSNHVYGNQANWRKIWKIVPSSEYDMAPWDLLESIYISRGSCTNSEPSK